MCEVAMRVNNLLNEYDQTLQQERQKVTDIKNERDQIAKQMDQYQKNMI